jgi:cytochrome d ubiquinol oxidase subunit I
MVALGSLFIALTLFASFLHWRGRLYETRWLLWVFVFAVLGAVAANQLGWGAAEVGRQPWVVHPPVVRGPDGEPALDAEGYIRYGTVSAPMPDGSTKEVTAGLRTADGVSEAVTANHVLGSIIMFGLIYLLLGALWVFVLNHEIHEGPRPPRAHPEGKRGFLEAARRRLEHGDLEGGEG